MELNYDQIKEMAENPSKNLLQLLSFDPTKDPPSIGSQPEELTSLEESAAKKIRISDEFFTGNVQYRVAWRHGVEGRKEYATAYADVPDDPENISPEFKGFVNCLLSSGVVTAALAVYFHTGEPNSTAGIVGTITTVATACFIANPITPAEFTRNVINASFGTRWGGWG